MQLHQLLHLVDRALELRDVHADVAKIAVEQQIAGDDIGHVAGAGLAAHSFQRLGDHTTEPNGAVDGFQTLLARPSLKTVGGLTARTVSSVPGSDDVAKALTDGDGRRKPSDDCDCIHGGPGQPGPDHHPTISETAEPQRPPGSDS